MTELTLTRGHAVSPYISGRTQGVQEYKDGKSYAEYMSEVTGCDLATGFGTVTHFFNMKNSLILEKAVPPQSMTMWV